MRERPILFSGPMVRAILAGDKTQTRRANGLGYFSRPENDPDGWLCARVEDSHAYMVYKSSPHERAVRCPYGQPGDWLWVREATYRRPMLNLLTGEPLAPQYDGGAYSADDANVLTPEGFDVAWWYPRKACPSIHMPRTSCRLVLEVTRVRVERLQQISDADCWAEGIEECDGLLDEAEICRLAKAMGRSIEDPQPIFAALWEQINGAGAWDANPWVWMVEFEPTAVEGQQ